VFFRVKCGKEFANTIQTHQSKYVMCFAELLFISKYIKLFITTCCIFLKKNVSFNEIKLDFSNVVVVVVFVVVVAVVVFVFVVVVFVVGGVVVVVVVVAVAVV